MKKTVMLMLLVMAMIVSAMACGSDKKEGEAPENVSTIYGVWKCTDADVLEIDLGGMSLPSSAEEMIRRQIESDMKGQTMTLSENGIRLDGDYIVFKDSGIRWHVLSLTDSRKKVAYDVESSYASASLKMKVEAVYEKL